MALSAEREPAHRHREDIGIKLVEIGVGRFNPEDVILPADVRRGEERSGHLHVGVIGEHDHMPF